jgi:hopanoid biosynthesis associated protein HpnK
MVGGAAVEDAVARARRLPDLRVGLHLALTDARPLLPPARLRGLVKRDGTFRDDMARVGLELAARPGLRRRLAAEVATQFQAFADTGLPLDHVNAHRHFHLHPYVARVTFRCARRHGAKATRVPAEPWRLVRSIDPAGRGWAGPLLGPWTMLLRRLARRAGLVAPDRVFGLAWSGAFTRERVEAVLDRLPEGSTELYFHPATRAGFPGAAPGYRYADELAALTAPSVHERAARPDVRRIGYADLAAAT